VPELFVDSSVVLNYRLIEVLSRLMSVGEFLVIWGGPLMQSWLLESDSAFWALVIERYGDIRSTTTHLYLCR
jgi:hypothetical protein